MKIKSSPNTPKLVLRSTPFFHSSDFVVSLLSFFNFFFFTLWALFLLPPWAIIAPCILFHFPAPLPIKAQSVFPFLTVQLTGSPMERLSKFPGIPHRNLLFHLQQMTAPWPNFLLSSVSHRPTFSQCLCNFVVPTDTYKSEPQKLKNNEYAVIVNKDATPRFCPNPAPKAR